MSLSLSMYIYICISTHIHKRCTVCDMGYTRASERGTVALHKTVYASRFVRDILAQGPC